ncbi:hypothetical protein L2E82_22431 [Cichorium intybus]|uniref:Uncharacterized protein n=1 Tax=Cichorium intybus TaxID=13427 RepID=A0ACB9DY34_CICIN|nr:hypothetical protein L2E82_22431 [Cichorium intybus]
MLTRGSTSSSKKGIKMSLVKRLVWNPQNGPPTKQLRSKIMVAIFNKPPGPLLASSVKDEQVMFRLLVLESSCG